MYLTKSFEDNIQQNTEKLQKKITKRSATIQIQSKVHITHLPYLTSKKKKKSTQTKYDFNTILRKQNKPGKG